MTRPAKKTNILKTWPFYGHARRIEKGHLVSYCKFFRTKQQRDEWLAEMHENADPKEFRGLRTAIRDFSIRN